MKINTRRKKKDGFMLRVLPLTAVLLLAIVGCGGGKEGEIVTGSYYNPALETKENETKDTEKNTESTEEAEILPGKDEISRDMFLIMDNDMQSQCLVLEQIVSGKQYMYNYSVLTAFVDKYGNHTSTSAFEPGRVVSVTEKDEQGRALKVQLSDKVWEYPDVTRYSVDEEHGVFEIAGTNYFYDDRLYVNSDGQTLTLADLTDMDILRVAGVGKQILSVSVTTGHGELELLNTELFEGSFIQVGSNIFAEITPEMKMEIPEGTYTVAVANNGYGGDTEIEIERGGKVTLDLDTLKGEGPKYGKILFAVDVAGAVLRIDGKVVDYSDAVELQYGVHTLTVSAESYDTYSKKLYVNSKEATIVIGLTGEAIDTMGTSDTVDKTDETNDADENENAQGDADNAGESAGNLAGSLAGSHTNEVGNVGNNSSAAIEDGGVDDAALDQMVNEILNSDKTDVDNNGNSGGDYLSTLTELISALKGNEN